MKKYIMIAFSALMMLSHGVAAPSIKEVAGTGVGGGGGELAVPPAASLGNCITTASDYSAIVGGRRNRIGPAAPGGASIGSFIGGGVNNTLDVSALSPGNSDFGVIGGGVDNNIVGAHHAGILGGGGNSIAVGSNFSAIGGGFSNAINSGSTYSWIGGGSTNVISSGSNYSVIVGGSANVINTGSNYSAILGGTGNSTAGLANVFIAGSGIAAVSANTLHVNGLWANGIPIFPAGFPYPIGTVFVVPVGTPPPAGIAGALYQM